MKTQRTKKQNPMKVIAVSAATHDLLKSLAKERGMTLYGLMRDLVAKGLNSEVKQSGPGVDEKLS